MASFGRHRCWRTAGCCCEAAAFPPEPWWRPRPPPRIRSHHPPRPGNLRSPEPPRPRPPPPFRPPPCHPLLVPLDGLLLPVYGALAVGASSSGPPQSIRRPTYPGCRQRRQRPCSDRRPSSSKRICNVGGFMHQANTVTFYKPHLKKCVFEFLPIW